MILSNTIFYPHKMPEVWSNVLIYCDKKRNHTTMIQEVKAVVMEEFNCTLTLIDSRLGFKFKSENDLTLFLIKFSG